MRFPRGLLSISLALLGGTVMACGDDDAPTSPGPAAKLSVQALPDQTARAPFASSVIVTIQDASGNTVTSSSASVTLAFGTNPGTMLWHMSGSGSGPNKVFEMVDPGTPVVIPGDSVLDGAEIAAMTYYVPLQLLLATDRDDNLLSVNPTTGVETALGFTGVDYFTGIAIESGAAPRLLGVTFNDSLYAVNQTTGLAAALGRMTVAGDSIERATGLATDPTSGTVYALVSLDSDADARIRHLVTVNTTTYVATDRGEISEYGMADIAFAANGTLYGVTGDGGTNSETLWTINKTTGAATLVLVLGNGSDGEAIAAGPATLSGTLTVNAVAGVATFPGLMINAAASGYTITATAGGLTAGTSAAFNVTP